MIVKDPNIAKLIANCACHEVVKTSYKPLWPLPVNGPRWASKISFLLWPIPKLVRYMCPAIINKTPIAKWWWASSVNHKLAVVGFNPPLNVKISEYFAQSKVKNGVKPSLNEGYKLAINSRLINNSWGSGKSAGSIPESNNLLIGFPIWIWWPAHDNEPKPSKTERWWFNIDSAFWNHSNFGAALW